MRAGEGPRLEVWPDAVAANYRALRARLRPGARLASVVKADAYGLGVARIAPALAATGCETFFVATLEEAITLRHTLREAQLYVFHGVWPGEAEAFRVHQLRPVLNSTAQLALWRQESPDLPYALHVDTGMQRLGLAPEEWLAASTLMPPPILLMSHLACAPLPDHAQNARQWALFNEARRMFCGVPASLANSSGIFLGEAYHGDLARPGCALYGISPTPCAANPMQPVARLSAPILQYRPLAQASAVGYHAAGHAPAGAVLATVQLGYADGLLRALSGIGQGHAGPYATPIVGIVSMDMVMVDVSHVPERLRTPDLRIDFIGPRQSVDALAALAGTIGYELFTRLGPRVQRAYRSGLPCYSGLPY